MCCLCCLCNKLARHWSIPKTQTWPSGRTRELPGSLPGPSRWEKRPGRICGRRRRRRRRRSPPSVVAVGPRRVLSASGPVASQLLPPTGVPWRDRLGRAGLTAEADVRCYRASLAASGALLRRCPLSRGPLVARVGRARGATPVRRRLALALPGRARAPVVRAARVLPRPRRPARRLFFMLFMLFMLFMQLARLTLG